MKLEGSVLNLNCRWRHNSDYLSNQVCSSKQKAYKRLDFKLSIYSSRKRLSQSTSDLINNFCEQKGHLERAHIPLGGDLDHLYTLLWHCFSSFMGPYNQYSSLICVSRCSDLNNRDKRRWKRNLENWKWF